MWIIFMFIARKRKKRKKKLFLNSIYWMCCEGHPYCWNIQFWTWWNSCMKNIWVNVGNHTKINISTIDHSDKVTLDECAGAGCWPAVCEANSQWSYSRCPELRWHDERTPPASGRKSLGLMMDSGMLMADTHLWLSGHIYRQTPTTHQRMKQLL